MSEHPGIVQLRQGFEAFAAGNMQLLNQIFADDVVWEVPGRNPFSGTYRGKVEMFGFLGNLIRATQGTLRNELVDAMASDRYAVAILRATATRKEMTLDQQAVAVFTTNPAGKIATAIFLFEDQYAVDEFYSA